MIRRRFLLTTAIALLAYPAIAQPDLKVGVAAEPYPPFSSKDASGQWVGWEIDVMNTLCAEMKEKCEIVEVAWDGIIPALTSKQIDMIMSSMAITPKRKETISFSMPYYNSPPALTGAKNGDKDASAEHLAGKTIGVQVSTIHSAYVEKHFGQSSTIKTYQTQDEANQDLAAGRIDYTVQEALSAQNFIKTESGNACCELKTTLPGDPEVLGEGVGVGLRQGDTALKDKIDTAIKAMAAAGTFEAISKKNGILGLIATPK